MTDHPTSDPLTEYASREGSLRSHPHGLVDLAQKTGHPIEYVVELANADRLCDLFDQRGQLVAVDGRPVESRSLSGIARRLDGREALRRINAKRAPLSGPVAQSILVKRQPPPRGDDPQACVEYLYRKRRRWR